MKTKLLFGASIIIFLTVLGGTVSSQSSGFWFPSGGFIKPVVDTFGVHSTDDLRFDDEILPDGSLCSDGQILKKTGADNWDCAADDAAASTTLDVIEDLNASSTVEFASSTWTIDTAGASSTLFIDGDAGDVTITELKMSIGTTSNSGVAINNPAIILDTDTTNNYGISFLTPNTHSSAGLFWSDSSDQDRGEFTYSHSGDSFSFNTGGNTRFLIDTGAIRPASNNGFDIGNTTRFWDEVFTSEVVLANAGTGATAANTVRLGGTDLSAGDAALLITSEDDTTYTFGSVANFDSELTIDAGDIILTDGRLIVGSETGGTCSSGLAIDLTVVAKGVITTIGESDTACDISFTNGVAGEVIFLSHDYNGTGIVTFADVTGFDAAWTPVQATCSGIDAGVTAATADHFYIIGVMTSTTEIMITGCQYFNAA